MVATHSNLPPGRGLDLPRLYEGPACTRGACRASALRGQQQAARLSESYERGETVDIAKVMMARQQASVGFEATLQVRNKLLSAYKDIMSMPV